VFSQPVPTDPLAWTMWRAGAALRARLVAAIGLALPLSVLALFEVAGGGAREGAPYAFAMGAWFAAVAVAGAFPPSPAAARRDDALLLRPRLGVRLLVPLLFIVPLTVAWVLSERATLVEMIRLWPILYFLPRALDRVLVTADGIEQRSPIWRRVRIGWREVARVDRFGVTLRVVGRGNSSISLPPFDGLPELARLLLERCPEASGAEPGIRRTLEALAEVGRAAPPARAPRHLLHRPLASLTLALAAGVAGAWALARPPAGESPYRFASPPGWVELSPGGDDPHFPEAAAWLRGRPDVVFAALEPPPSAGVPSEVAEWAVVFDSALGTDAAFTRLGPWLVDRAATDPGAVTVADRQVMTLGGVGVVRARLSSETGEALAYAVPLGPRTGVLVFTCAPRACPRLGPVADAAVAATAGLRTPTFRERREGRQTYGALGLVLLAGAVLVGTEAVLRRPARSDGRVGYLARA
jgi:hypothetical protein